MLHNTESWPFDLAVSLGPNCRSTWNLRRFVGVDHTFPFDWWITPTSAMLKMIRPEFRFELDLTDLVLVNRGKPDASVYNKRYGVLHHHDFPRDAEHQILPLTSAVVEAVRLKYVRRFERFRTLTTASLRPVFVLNGTFGGWREGFPEWPDAAETFRGLSEDDTAEAIRQAVGSKAFVCFIGEGSHQVRSTPWGGSFHIEDDGRREAPTGSEYAEPVNVFRRAYSWLASIQSVQEPFTPKMTHSTLSPKLSRTPDTQMLESIVRQLYLSTPEAPDNSKSIVKSKFAPSGFLKPVRRDMQHNKEC